MGILASTKWILIIITTLAISVNSLSETQMEEIEEGGRYMIEGKVYPPELYSSDTNWQKDTYITINDGEYNGFLKDDGTFAISNVPSGSYVVEIINPDYFYESVSKILPIYIVFFVKK